MLVLGQLVEGHDARVVQAGGSPSLTGRAAGLGLLVPGHDLDGHVALEVLVAAEPHHAEASGAQPALQAIAPEHEPALGGLDARGLLGAVHPASDFGPGKRAPCRCTGYDNRGASHTRPISVAGIAFR